MLNAWACYSYVKWIYVLIGCFHNFFLLFLFLEDIVCPHLDMPYNVFVLISTHTPISAHPSHFLKETCINWHIGIFHHFYTKILYSAY